MKRTLIFVAWSLAVLALSTGVLTAMYWTKRTIWPEFPQATDPAPQVVVSLEPDFAWRIGDRIPMHIYLREEPNIEVDVNSLAFEGDFEIAGNPELVVRERKDGTRLIHLNVTLQSFTAAPKLGFKGTLTYTVAGQREPKTLTIAGPDLYTSRTWDGRPDIKDGPLPRVHGWHYWTSGIALVVGLIGSIVALVYYRRVSRKPILDPSQIPLNRWQAARQEFNQVWRQIEDGDESPQRFKEIERIIRHLYHIETRTSREVPFELGQNHPHLNGIMTIIGLCDKVLFAHQALTPEEKQQIRTTFDTMIPAPKRVPTAPKKR